MNFQIFEAAINQIKKSVETEDRIMEALGVEGIVTLFSESNRVIIDLLEHSFACSEEEWIDWWIWETDFGIRNYEVECEGEVWQLNSIANFYDFMRGLK
jgi:hypothetical protein